MTIFLVYKPKTATNGQDYWQSPWGNDNGGWDRFYYSSFGHGFTSNDPETGIVSLGLVSPSYQPIPAAGMIDEVYLQTTAYDGAVSGGTNNGPTNGSAVYFNGDLVQSFTDNTHATAAFSELSIGWDGDTGPFDGQIAEVMVYSRILTACELEQINNALGLKYGKDFSGFTASYDHSSLFNINPNAIGIASSACGSTVQVDEASSSQVTINNPTSNNTANEFLIIAHNDIPSDQLSNNIPSGTTIRLERVWRAEEETNTNSNAGVDLGLVDVIFDLSTIGLTDVGVDEYLLLIDDDGADFSNATIFESSPGVKLIGTYANGKVTFSGVDLDHNDHFTLAVYDVIVPTVTVEQAITQADP
ncbi:MAG: LamG-like jellyroll fold domain-containing protein, partial [Bacteroidia bacterium]